MATHSRRAFIRTTGLGVAAVGVANALPGSVKAAETPAEATTERDDGTVAEGSFVAYVRDARTGEIAVFVGEREVRVTDKALARSIAKAAGA